MRLQGHRSDNVRTQSHKKFTWSWFPSSDPTGAGSNPRSRTRRIVHRRTARCLTRSVRVPGKDIKDINKLSVRGQHDVRDEVSVTLVRT